jgi:hypothetical protein
LIFVRWFLVPWNSTIEQKGRGQRYFSMKQAWLMKKMIVGFGIVVAFVTPSLAQSYIASYGTGT